MALKTKTISAKGSRDHHTFTLTVNEDSTNVNNNTSSLSFTFTLTDDNDWFWSAQGTYVSYSITIGSHTYSGYIPHHTDVTTEVRSEDDITEVHNSDGTKTINIGFTVTDSSSIYYLPGNASASSTMALTTIPRASGVSVGNVTISSTSGSLSATINPQASFWHRWKYVIGSYDSGWTNMSSAISSATSISVAYTTILSKIPTSSSGTVVFTVETHNSNDFNSSSYIGTASATSTVTITLKPSAPTLTTLGFRSRSSGVNSNITTPTAGYTTVALTSWSSGTSSGATSYITYFSVDQGASLQTTSATTNNTVIETNTLPASAKQYTLTYTAYTVDSRGNKSSNATKTVEVYGYSTPTLNLTAYRVASDTSTTEDATGTKAYVTFSNNMRGQTDANGSLKSGNQNAIISAVCKYGSTTVTSGAHINLAVENTLTFTYTVQDRFTTTSTTRTVNSASFPLDLYDNGSGSVGVGFGAVAIGGWLTSGLKNDLSRGNKTRVGIQTAYESTNSSSGSGYMIIATIKPKGAWDNKAITFKILRRGINHPSNVSIRFDGANSTDPGLSSFVADFNSTDFYLYKSATSTWQLISYKTNYDQISLLAVYADDYVLSLNDIDTTQSVISAVPDGAVQATEWSYLHAQFATNATNTMWTNNSNTTARNYYVPFGDGASTANRGLQVHSGLSFWGRVGTASADGYVLLKLGNGTNVGTAGNMWGELDIYPRTGNYYIGVQAPNTMTATRIIRFPDGGGTLEVKTALYALNILGGNEATVTGVKGTYQRLRVYAKASGSTFTVWEVDVNQITTSANKFSHSVPIYASDVGDWYLTIYDLKLTQSGNDVKVYFDCYNKRIGTSGQSTQNNNSNYAIYKIEGIV